MHRGYSREEQRCSQTSIFDPLSFSSKHARCYEHVVSVKGFNRVRNMVMLGVMLNQEVAQVAWLTRLSIPGHIGQKRAMRK